MAQLVEWSLPTPEIRGFESRHRQNFIYQLYNRKDKNKEKEAGKGPSLKKPFKSLHKGSRDEGGREKICRRLAGLKLDRK